MNEEWISDKTAPRRRRPDARSGSTVPTCREQRQAARGDVAEGFRRHRGQGQDERRNAAHRRDRRRPRRRSRRCSRSRTCCRKLRLGQSRRPAGRLTPSIQRPRARPICSIPPSPASKQADALLIVGRTRAGRPPALNARTPQALALGPAQDRRDRPQGRPEPRRPSYVGRHWFTRPSLAAGMHSTAADVLQGAKKPVVHGRGRRVLARPDGAADPERHAARARLWSSCLVEGRLERLRARWTTAASRVGGAGPGLRPGGAGGLSAAANGRRSVRSNVGTCSTCWAPTKSI